MTLAIGFVRGKVASFFREPLVHFLLIGAGLFVFWHYGGDRLAPNSARIVITPGQVERLTQAWTKTHLRPPNSDELEGLVEEEIDEEILFREAIALGLDRDDLVIRRRLAVKMEFLADDLAATANPSEHELKNFLRDHPEKFQIEPLTTFRQVFVNRSERGEVAGAEATRLLEVLNGEGGSNWQSLGDSFPVPNEFQAAKTADIARHFGKEFPEKLARRPVGRWSGPIESKYGLHLILIQERSGGRTPELKEVHDVVAREWRAAQRRAINATLRRERRAKYDVTVQWPDWARQDGELTTQTSGSKETR